VKIGKIVNTHGLKGELSIFLENREQSQLNKKSQIYIEDNNKQQKFSLKNIKFLPKKVLIQLEGFLDINAVEKFKGKDFFVERSSLEECDEDEFYLSDIIGFSFISKMGKKLGEVQKYYSNGSQDIAVLIGGEVTDYPLLPNLIIEINYEKKEVIVQDLEVID